MSRLVPDFLVKRREGYYCRYGDFYLDPKYPVRRALISHAHGDHATPGHLAIYCTLPTARFMQYRFPGQTKSSFHVFGFHEVFRVGDVIVRFVPAGHILGSAQVLMEYQGIRYLFTGDYKRQADETCEPLEVVPADVLITESTFADPQVVHPDPAGEIGKLNRQPFPILLGAYGLGKAQRLTNLINRYCPGRRVLVHPTIVPLHRLYETMGIRLQYEQYNKKALADENSKDIFVVPPMTFDGIGRRHRLLRVFASGWKHRQFGNDLALYISDHVDWPDIIHYVAQVKPVEIWTMHGDGQHLVQYYAGQIQVRAIG